MSFLDRLLGRTQRPDADLANEAQRRRAEGMDERSGGGEEDSAADRIEEGAHDARTQGTIERGGDPLTG